MTRVRAMACLLIAGRPPGHRELSGPSLDVPLEVAKKLAARLTETIRTKTQARVPEGMSQETFLEEVEYPMPVFDPLEGPNSTVLITEGRRKIWGP